MYGQLYQAHHLVPIEERSITVLLVSETDEILFDSGNMYDEESENN